MAEDETLPVRYAHCCKVWDDHPRAMVITVHDNAATDELYHYDCLSPEYVAAHPEIWPAIEATSKGLRGQDVRDVMMEHAANLPEAPADPTSLEDLYRALNVDPAKLSKAQRKSIEDAHAVYLEAVAGGAE